MMRHCSQQESLVHLLAYIRQARTREQNENAVIIPQDEPPMEFTLKPFDREKLNDTTQALLDVYITEDEDVQIGLIRTLADQKNHHALERIIFDSSLETPARCEALILLTKNERPEPLVFLIQNLLTSAVPRGSSQCSLCYCR